MTAALRNPATFPPNRAVEIYFFHLASQVGLVQHEPAASLVETQLTVIASPTYAGVCVVVGAVQSE